MRKKDRVRGFLSSFHFSSQDINGKRVISSKKILKSKKVTNGKDMEILKHL